MVDNHCISLGGIGFLFGDPPMVHRHISYKMSKVVHFKKSPFDVYVGRPSKWGNPFSHKSDTQARFRTETRTEAIAAYRQWITEGDGMYLLDDLHELKGKVLGCWCHPLPCHADVLSELSELANDPFM